jgi:hypothetical protein
VHDLYEMNRPRSGTQYSRGPGRRCGKTDRRRIEHVASEKMPLDKEREFAEDSAYLVARYDLGV